MHVLIFKEETSIRTDWELGSLFYLSFVSAFP